MTERILKSIWLHPFRWLAGFLLIVVSFFVICSGQGNQPSSPTQSTRAIQETETPAEENLLPSEGLESGATPDSPEVNQPPENQSPEDGSSLDPLDGDETAAEVAQGKKISLERAALPFLPLKTRNVTAEYKNQLSNGDLVIEVSFKGTKAEAVREWESFLDKYQDPGTAYLVIYKPV
jgi:hypothetical protein